MREMKLVKETIEDVEENGYSESDIKWVGSKDGKYGMSWDSFKKAFNKILGYWNTLREIQLGEEE